MVSHLAEQEFQIAVGETTEAITKFLKSRGDNVFVTIVSLDIIKHVLMDRTLILFEDRSVGKKEK